MTRKPRRHTYSVAPNPYLLPLIGIGYFISVALCVAAFPVTLPITARKFRRQFKKDREEARDYQIRLGQRRATSPPRGMPRSRRQAMSLGRRRKTTDQQTPVLQEDSELLSLPSELRHLIWEEYIAGSTIHLHNHGHHRCTLKTPGPCIQVAYTAQQKAAVSEISPMSLFLTCRQIYLEAADHFYTGNCFTTNDAETIEFMPRLLPRHRIDTIHSLRFVWKILGDPPFPLFDWDKLNKRRPDGSKKGIRFKRKMWITTWANLASMKSLRELRVALDVGSDRYRWQEMEIWEEVAVLEPIMGVTTPGLFELTIPVAKKGDNGAWDALPCVVRRESVVQTYCLKFVNRVVCGER